MNIHYTAYIHLLQPNIIISPSSEYNWTECSVYIRTVSVCFPKSSLVWAFHFPIPNKSLTQLCHITDTLIVKRASCGFVLFFTFVFYRLLLWIIEETLLFCIADFKFAKSSFIILIRSVCSSISPPLTRMLLTLNRNTRSRQQ